MNNNTSQQPQSPEKQQEQSKSGRPLGRIIMLGITALCFAYLYYRIYGAAGREGLSVAEYMLGVFANVNWLPWLGLMMAYSLFYFLIDTLVVSRALNWFLTSVRYWDILPIRACAYIISIFNEQVGKGAMAYYLKKRDGVQFIEVVSVMLFIMFCEFFYLLAWATAGYFGAVDRLPAEFGLIPYIAFFGVAVLILWMLFFHGTILPGVKLREQRLLHSFRKAKPWHYAAFFLLRSPALLAAVAVYSISLGYFGVEMDMLTLLPFLPVIFFGAIVPVAMRGVAITFWVILFPEQEEGQMLAFGLLQHNFFLLFNALLGLVFWRRASRELFPEKSAR